MYEQVDAMYHQDTGGGHCAVGQILCAKRRETLLYGLLVNVKLTFSP